VGPRNHVLDGVEIPMRRGNFRGCPAHSKAIAVSAVAFAAEGINNSTMWPFINVSQYHNRTSSIDHISTDLITSRSSASSVSLFQRLFSSVALSTTADTAAAGAVRLSSAINWLRL